MTATVRSVLVLDVPRRVLDKRLPDMELARQQAWDSGNTRERWGRYHRLLGDPAYVEELTYQAEQTARVLGHKGGGWVRAANLLRLAGDEDKAREWLEHAEEVFAAAAKSHIPVDWDTHGHQIEGRFLLGRDAEAGETCEWIKQLRRSKGARLRAPIVADLADARRTRDAEACQAVIDWFDHAIRRYRTHPTDDSAIGLHDWLELALITHSEITGTRSPRLREIPTPA